MSTLFLCNKKQQLFCLKNDAKKPLKSVFLCFFGRLAVVFSRIEEM
jgi:hypothetical protein